MISRGPRPDEQMTVEQVAEIVKVAATTVRMWIHSGQLRAIRPGVGRKGQGGRTFRVSRAALKEFVASVQGACSGERGGVVDAGAGGQRAVSQLPVIDAPR
jgi:excisionase family DNA binding protein